MAAAYPLIGTKIRTPPRQRTSLRRDRLINFVHSNIQHKLILVSAGPGYGKTSLLVDYAHDTDLPVCWLTLDANDGYLPTFIEYLVGAIRTRFPRFGERVLEALHGYQGPSEAVEPFVRLLVDELEAGIDQYSVIILDNYNEVIESEPVNALLDGVLRYLPEPCHVIIASRGIPRRLTLSRLAARQEVVGMGVQHLRFTEDEIALVLRTLGRDDLSPEQVHELAERSEGWITGVLLAAQSGWDGTTRKLSRLTGATDAVFRFMAAEILDRQEPHVRRFLLGSALLTEMSAPLCDALLEATDSAQVLRWLAEQSLFTMPLDAEGTWYQYHQLFREFLVAKLESEASGEYRRLCLRHAGLMANQGRWPQAIEGYIAAQAYEQAADAVEIVAQDLYAAGHRELLARWIDVLPEVVQTAHPLLLLRRGRVYAEAAQWEQADLYIGRAFQLLVEREDTVGAARALVQRAIAFRMQERTDEAIATCGRVAELGGEGDPLASTQMHHTLGICYSMKGDVERGEMELRRALDVARSHMDDASAAYIAHDLGNAAVMRGRLLDGRRSFHEALLHWRKSGNASNLAMTLQGLGVVHQYLGQYAEAESRFQESLAKARSHANTRLEVYALINQGDLFRDTNQYERALGAYRASIELASQTRITSLIVYAQVGIGDTYRLMGDLVKARQYLAETADQVQESQMPYEAGLCYLARGALAVSEGRAEIAEAHLARVQALLERTGSTRDLGRLYLQRAMLAHRLGKTEAIAEHMRKVADVAADLGTAQFVVAEGPTAVPVLEQGGLPDAVKVRAEIEQLFSPAAVEARKPPSPVSHALRLLGLQGGQVMFHGRQVTDWESSVARDLAFLLATYPEGLRRDQVIVALWPDISPAKANSQFYSTTHRLRQALTKESVVHEQGLYRLSRSLSIYYDVAEFQTLARQGRADTPSAHEARTRALALYREDFLPMCDCEWADTLRESLKRMLHELLTLEGRHLLRANLLPEAEAVYLRALAEDALDEETHRGIMLCRALSGDRAGALRQYRECLRVLKSQLGEAPSPETVSLAQDIGAGRVNVTA